MIAAVVRHLAPGGRFILTWPDNPDVASFEPIRQPDGALTYPDREPYHYSFDMLARVCDALGARAERMDDASHPRGEAVMVITVRLKPDNRMSDHDVSVVSALGGL